MQNPIVIAFSQKASCEFQDIIRRLVTVIISTKHPLDMDIKWRQLTFALNADFHHWICAIKITKKHISLVFHFGGLFADPGAVFKVGSSKFLRSIEYQTVEDIKESDIQNFIDQAVDRLPYFKENWKEIQKNT